MPPFDFTALRARITCGHASAVDSVEQAMAAAQSAAAAPAFLRTDFAGARAAAGAPNAHLPLHGVAVSVKALFDVQGWPSCAGAALLADAPPAARDAPAVARLRAAGASIVGHTHMVEFAFSGVGTNPHYATPTAFDARHAQAIDPPRVPGGSSSGAAVSVATGAAWLGLGSDTGGSIRIPAALNGLVGFKSTARLVPTAGTVPLSHSLDTACAMTRSVRDAVTAHEILAARTVPPCLQSLRDWRLAVPSTLMLEQLEPAVQHAFARTLEQLRHAGAHITPIALPELLELADINAQGGLTAAESYAWHQQQLGMFNSHAHRYDPRVHQRIARGSAITAADYQRIAQRRTDWIARMQARLQPWDALLSPTTPITAPLLHSVAPATGEDATQDAQRDAAFTQTNALLLRNTSVVNMLDGCALSLPCHQKDELPMGLMVWHGALHDDAILHISAHIEAALQPPHL